MFPNEVSSNPFGPKEDGMKVDGCCEERGIWCWSIVVYRESFSFEEGVPLRASNLKAVSSQESEANIKIKSVIPNRILCINIYREWVWFMVFRPWPRQIISYRDACNDLGVVTTFYLDWTAIQWHVGHVHCMGAPCIGFQLDQNPNTDWALAQPEHYLWRHF